MHTLDAVKIRGIKCDNPLADVENIMSIILSNKIHVYYYIFIIILTQICVNVRRIIIPQVFKTPH